MNYFFNHDLNEEIGDREVIAVMCSGGFTSSMMAQRMQKHFAETGEPYYAMYASIHALSEQDFLDLYAKKISIIFISPQVHHHFEQARDHMKSFDIPVLKIDSRVFGTMNYKSLINTAFETLAVS